MKRLLGRNSAMTPTEALGWKHGHPSAIAIPADLAVICVVRRADNWALSMHAKPWHSTAALQALDFSDFIRAPWDTIIDRARYFKGSAEQGLVGQPLQADRDPVTGRRPETLFALRRSKMNGLLSYLERGCTCAVLRMEDMQAAPEDGLDRVLDALGLPVGAQPFRPVFKRLGSKFKPAIAHRPETPKELSKADRDFLNAQIDQEVETALGYTYE
ncbi:hypothetical protein ACXYMO_00195 [Arenibacterium sp. CAU 1754]